MKLDIKDQNLYSRLVTVFSHERNIKLGNLFGKGYDSKMADQTEKGGISFKTFCYYFSFISVC